MHDLGNDNMEPAQTEKQDGPLQHGDEYKEEDAIVTLIAAAAGAKESDVRRVLDHISKHGTQRERDAVNDKIGDITNRLSPLWKSKYNSEARRAIIRLGARVMALNRVITFRTLRFWLFSRPPGDAMLSIARLFFSEHKIDRVFKPIVADYLEEYQHAQKEGNWKLAVVRTQHWYGFLKACGLDKVIWLIELLNKIFKIW